MLLKQGDTVAVAATARKISPEEIAPAIRLFESWGLRVLVPDGLYEADNQFAGSDFHRAALFQKLLDDKRVKAIFCARGGYGTVRMVDKLDFTLFLRHPKWIVGYSDVTVLHSHISRLFGVPTLHAIMPINIPDNAAGSCCPAVESLLQCLFSDSFDYHFDSYDDGLVDNRAGECKAKIVGGNLSVLYSLLGSFSDIDTDGKILLIEDLDEYLYHIDRMVMALKRAGKLSRLAGLIVGAMTDMHDNTVPFGRTAEEIVRDAVAEYQYPVAYHCPFGHIGTDNIALPMGVEVNFKVAENCVTVWR